MWAYSCVGKLIIVSLGAVHCGSCLKKSALTEAPEAGEPSHTLVDCHASPVEISQWKSYDGGKDWKVEEEERAKQQ